MIRSPSAAATCRPAARWRVAVALALAALPSAAAVAADTLRIAASRAPVSLPLYVAQQRGFFADEQLDVVISDCIGGTRCLRQWLDDKADLATTSEMPVVLQAFKSADVAIVQQHIQPRLLQIGSELFSRGAQREVGHIRNGHYDCKRRD